MCLKYYHVQRRDMNTIIVETTNPDYLEWELYKTGDEHGLTGKCIRVGYVVDITYIMEQTTFEAEGIIESIVESARWSDDKLRFKITEDNLVYTIDLLIKDISHIGKVNEI